MPLACHGFLLLHCSCLRPVSPGYKWTDESGRTVYADAPPAKASKVKHVEVVIDDDPPTRRREQELEQRIARLEREVRAAQSAPPQYPAAAPQYPTALPPPDYYASSS